VLLVKKTFMNVVCTDMI